MPCARPGVQVCKSQFHAPVVLYIQLKLDALSVFGVGRIDGLLLVGAS